MNTTYLVMCAMAVLAGFSAGFAVAMAFARREVRELSQVREAREKFLSEIATSERELQAHERRELYSRIQAYDPNAGDYEPRPPSITAPPSRPGEPIEARRSHTEEELGQMGLVEQADGLIRDPRSDALFETVEDWRFWQADLKKRNLPPEVHPEAVQELGWEGAVAVAKEQTAAKKALSKN